MKKCEHERWTRLRMHRPSYCLLQNHSVPHQLAMMQRMYVNLIDSHVLLWVRPNVWYRLGAFARRFVLDAWYNRSFHTVDLRVSVFDQRPLPRRLGYGDGDGEGDGEGEGAEGGARSLQQAPATSGDEHFHVDTHRLFGRTLCEECGISAASAPSVAARILRASLPPSAVSHGIAHIEDALTMKLKSKLAAHRESWVAAVRDVFNKYIPGGEQARLYTSSVVAMIEG